MQPINPRDLPTTFVVNTPKTREQPAETFKNNLKAQLENIRNALLKAIRNPHKSETIDSNQWWASQAPVLQAAVEVTSQAIGTNANLAIICAGKENICTREILNHLKQPISSEELVDAIIAPHTLYGEMEELFNASEALLKGKITLDKHPLFKYFNRLKSDGIFIATLNSGPNITCFTELLLNKHGLETEKANRTEHINLTLFNNVETFFRVLDIFKRHFEIQTGKTIDIDLSYSMPHLPLDHFCQEYINQYPELIDISSQDLEKFVRLISVFNVGEEIVDLNITLKMTVKKKPESRRSFMPINQKHDAVQKGSNEISLGQLDLTRQIQNLNGSEESMRYIKDADGQAQLNAFQKVFARSSLKIVDLGGGRGETNAVLNALREKGSTIRLLNIEPDPKFAAPYKAAHHSIGIEDVHVLQLYAKDLSVQDVLNHYNGEKADAIFASHFLYFLLGDLLKASLDINMPIEEHPLWKYFSMMEDNGVMVATMQSGAGSRLFRNALLGNHGLNPAQVADESVPLLSSFGNLATFLRHFEVFSTKFKQATGRTIKVKMAIAVANVPLGAFTIDQDPKTRGYMLHNPNGSTTDPNWLSPTMLDFYGNWKEQQSLAASGNETARKTQETFLHILRAFAPAEVNMQHPNITLEIKLDV